MKNKRLWLVMMFMSSLLAAKTSIAANPTAFNVTVYKTEICQDTACTAILDDAAGVSVDLISGDGAFGSNPAITPGSYNTFRFTMANGGTFSGSNTACTGTSTASAQAFKINSSLTPSDQITVAFATGDAVKPGGTGWYANGSDDHPYLMLSTLDVLAGKSTNVTMQFQTADTLSCDTSSNISIEPPGFAISSHIETTTAAFTGGDYWYGSYKLQATTRLIAVTDYLPGTIAADYPPAGVTVVAGTQITPGYTAGGASIYYSLLHGSDAAAYRAQIRSNSYREFRYGGKASFTAPNNIGEGQVSLWREEGVHKHMLVPDAGVSDPYNHFSPASSTDLSVPMATIQYEIDSNNRVTFQTPSGPVVGALSRDFEFLYLAEVIEGINVTMAVKVSPGSTVGLPTGDFSWNQYGMGINRFETGVDTVENGNEETLNMFNYADVGWMTNDGTDIFGATLRSEISIQNPTTASPVFTNEARDDYLTASVAALGISFTDGAGYMTGADGQWFAASPDGETILAIGDAVNDSEEKDPGIYTHYLNYMLITSLADVGATSTADLVGTYYFAGMWDSSGADYIDFGGSVGEVVLESDGTGQVAASAQVNSDGVVTSSGANFNWTIDTICLGVEPDAGSASGYSRIATTATPCSAGVGGAARAVDIVRITDTSAGGGGGSMEMFISRSGDTLTYYNPDNVNATTATTIKRELGAMVRLTD
ncbi:MAG: hypothetical protein OEY29_15465 [Gammaproteobacteria bacterium]|nr:hypothetical protein [Gammaproteobacteria bacterium]